MGFKDIYGQNRAIALLKAGFKAGRNSHAYLFYGPEGVGKFKTAVAFAQLLNCSSPTEEAEPCGTCIACRKIISGSHPDLIVVRPDGNSLKIEQMRILQEKVYYKCYEGKFKVIIIDDAHLLTIEAANSLLKVLEEPPAETVFILLANDLNKLPITIHSRCQPLPFSYLDEMVLRKILQQQGKETPPTLDLAQGSASKALEMVDNPVYQQFWEQAKEKFKAIKQGGYREIFSWAEKLDKAKDRKLCELTLEWLLVMYRNKIVEQDFSGADLAGCFTALEEINKAVYAIKNNGNYRLTMEVLLIKLRNIEQRERGVIPNG
ncbi:MAG: DNA polymerase III subunit delta' [Peptococcia bacterium]|jgi:DNA polymerase-3 subunit delta'